MDRSRIEGRKSFFVHSHISKVVVQQCLICAELRMDHIFYTLGIGSHKLFDNCIEGFVAGFAQMSILADLKKMIKLIKKGQKIDKSFHLLDPKEASG